MSKVTPDNVLVVASDDEFKNEEGGYYVFTDIIASLGSSATKEYVFLVGSLPVDFEYFVSSGAGCMIQIFEDPVVSVAGTPIYEKCLNRLFPERDGSSGKSSVGITLQGGGSLAFSSPGTQIGASRDGGTLATGSLANNIEIPNIWAPNKYYRFLLTSLGVNTNIIVNFTIAKV